MIGYLVFCGDRPFIICLSCHSLVTRYLTKNKISDFAKEFPEFMFTHTFIIHLQATDNPKVKNRISLELSFVNSNLQLLKEKLSELNSSVEIYQNDSGEVIMPFIPIGLKETVDINFMDTFSQRVSKKPCWHLKCVDYE